MKVKTVFQKAEGIIVGVIAGTLLWALIKIKYFGGLNFSSIVELFIQLSPGIFVGAIIGFIFSKVFSHIAGLL